MSPYRQSPFRGVFSGYLFHGARRLASNAPFFVPPFAAGTTAFSRSLPRYALKAIDTAFSIPFLPPCWALSTGYAVYTWAKATDHYNNSKQAHIDALKSGGEHHGH